MGFRNFKVTKWKLGKRGVIEDIPILIAMLFAFFIVILVLHRVYTDMNDSFINTGAIDNNTQAHQILQRGQTAMNLFDFIFVMVMVVLMIGLLYLSFQQDAHPIFFFLTLFLMIATVIIAAAFSNTVNDLLGTGATGTSGTFTNESGTFPMTAYIFDHLPLVVVVIMSIGAILLYGKLRLR